MLNVPGPIIIPDPNDATGTKAVTVKDETGKYPDTYSLDVNVRSGIVQVKLSGENLRYEKMGINQVLTNGVYLTVLNKTTTVEAKLIWARCIFSNNNVDIRVTVDGNVIMTDYNLGELASDYYLDIGNEAVSGTDFIRTERQGKVLVLTFPGGMEYNSYFKIEAKANGNNYQMQRGLLVRSED